MPISSLTSGNGAVHPARIFTYSPEMLGVELAAMASAAPAGTAWPANQEAFYIPLKIEATVTVKTIGVAISADGTAATLDVGIYNSAGTRLVSKGNTAVAATSTWQSFDITDTVLIPGLYYIGILGAWATTAPSVYRHSLASSVMSRCYYYQAVGAADLPASAIFANSARDYLPHVCVNLGSVAS